ncbi:MAG: Ig-like domain-containing protein [Burkholderiales bacterium]|nr:Ig-like domain-containing protein [Burkholderiales bacterium]
MNLFKNRCYMTKFIRAVFAVLMLVILTACGGGGGSAGGTGTGSTSGSGSGSSSGSTTGTSTTGTTSNVPVLTLSLSDASGAAITNLSGVDTGVVKAKFVTGAGLPVANALVTFSGDVALIKFTPAAATALTDANGVAVMNILPASTTAAGALSIKADAVSGTLTASTSVNLAISPASLTVGTLSFTPVPAGSLPAFSTVTVNIPVTTNGKPVTAISGLNLTSKCVVDGTATLVQGPTGAPGVFTATYTNKGCVQGTDLITVSIGNSSQSISLAVGSANIGTLQFVGTDSAGSSLVLKGSGGAGRKESALVTFKVVDQNNVGLAGVVVNFSATTYTGGLTVLPASAATDVDGNVATTVSSGTIPTPVKVIATATRNGVTISGLSDYLTISTGLPIQKFMSLSVEKANIEGWNYDSETTGVTVLMADQYGNPVSDNTTVNFVTEGGAIGSSAQGACNTVNGGCTVQLRSQAFRPSNGRVTVLAYAQGLENFVDSNGDGQYSCANPGDANGVPLADPKTYRPVVDTCISGGEPFPTNDLGDMGDAFLDAGILGATSGTSLSGTLDGAYTAANGDLPVPYNHVGYVAAGDGKWGMNYIRRSAEVVFSGSAAYLIRQVCTAGVCRDWDSTTDGDPSIIQGVAGVACSDKSLNFRLTDLNNNPLPYGTLVATADATKIGASAVYPDKIVSTNSVGGTFHSVTVKRDDPNCGAGSFFVTVKTLKGNGTAFKFNSN